MVWQLVLIADDTITFIRGKGNQQLTLSLPEEKWSSASRQKLLSVLY
jgi:hypothetical protein